MKSWHKTILIAGSTVAISLFGCWIYKKLKSKNTVESNDVTDEYNDESKVQNFKIQLPDLIDEIIIESLEKLCSCMSQVSKISKERATTQTSILRKLSGDIHENIESIEIKVCGSNGWNYNKYKEKAYLETIHGNSEIIKRSNLLEEIVKQLLHGEIPVVNLEFDPKLTKEVTLSLFKRIMMSYLYLYYQKTRKLTEKGESITNEQMLSIISSVEIEKNKKRYCKNLLLEI